MDNSASSDRGGPGMEMRRLAENLSRLVRSHIDLAKLELREEAKGLAADALLGAMALPFLLAALLLLDGALAVGIGTWLGIGWGLAIVGVLNLGVGLVLGGLVAARLRARPARMEATNTELQRNVEMLQRVKHEASARASRKRTLISIPDQPPAAVGRIGAQATWIPSDGPESAPAPREP